MLHSKAKGTLGVMKVAADLISKGFLVFSEIGDLSSIDLIGEKDKKLYRFQVKTHNSEEGKVKVYSVKTGPNNYFYHYQSDEIDIFAVYVLDKDLILYVSSQEICSAKKSITIRLEETKNNQKKKTRTFQDYTLDKILDPNLHNT